MMKITGKRLLTMTFIALVITLLLISAEMGARIAGTIDFPIYHTDEEIGYIPEPSQHGEFLRKNQWVINDKSMGTGRWEPNADRDILLIGDSIVWGGNMLSQPEKLGPLLEKKMFGWRVWPASAGGWSAANEIIYLKRNPDVQAQADVVIWVLNSGDFDIPSKWDSDELHPRKKPFSALVYLFEKYGMSWLQSSVPAENSMKIVQGTETSLHDQVADMRHEKPRREMIFLLYPRKNELAGTTPEKEAFYVKFRDHLRNVLGPDATIIEVRNDSRWNSNLYRDGIHPTAEGNAILAAIITDHLKAKPVDPIMPSLTPR